MNNRIKEQKNDLTNKQKDKKHKDKWINGQMKKRTNDKKKQIEK
jgi:hypothetical protein